MLAIVGINGSARAASRAAPAVHGIGENEDPTRQTDENWVDDRWQKTDIGQFLSTALDLPGEKVVKAIAIKVGETYEAAVCFDTELLSYRAEWIGGFLQLNPKRYGLLETPKPKGTIQFKSGATLGWAHDGNFADPRTNHLGNLPRGWGHYKGLYLSGNRVVLAYTVGGAEVLDSPGLAKAQGIAAFSRTLEVSASRNPLQLRLCKSSRRAMRQIDGATVSVSEEGSDVLAVALVGSGAALTNDDSGFVELRLPASETSRLVKALIWRGPRSNLSNFAALVKASAPAGSLKALTHGGPAHWTKPVMTRGSLGFGTGPLLIDTLTVPYQNPWNALMFTSGHDFFANGDAAVCTAHGDVWRVSGIDAKLQKLTWKRFATGLFQPLGLKIIRDQVYVLGRDQITILHDLDHDGEADYYENFNSDCISAGAGHSYCTCLETDAAGNFYFLKCAENTPHGGTILRVSADGQELNVVATGFRNPNGMAIGPTDLITVADQQGEWVPETRVDWIRPGGFYGYMPMNKRAEAPRTYDGPLCWIARTIDNSAGGQAWVPEGSWGALSGQMLHLSYGRCTMMLILRDESSHTPQAAVVPLPGRFLSGVMRGRFNPRDGQLYVSGLRGWQTAAVRDGCFQRVRYTGQPFYLPIGYSVRSNGIQLSFSQPLQQSAAENVESYAIEQWNYRWTSTYGSPDFSLIDPAKEGRDKVPVKTAKLSGDDRSLFLEIPDLRPAMQTKIQFNLVAADGKTMRNEVYATINALPK